MRSISRQLPERCWLNQFVCSFPSDLLHLRDMERIAAEREIEKIIDSQLRTLDFKKKGKKWYRITPETICRVTLSKNRWKRHQQYLEMDVSVLNLNAEPSNEPTWHIIGSMFSPDVNEKVEWEKCLNTRYDTVSGKARQLRLVEILREKIIPLLKSFESLEGIRTSLFSGTLRGMGVRTELQDLTGYRA